MNSPSGFNTKVTNKNTSSLIYIYPPCSSHLKMAYRASSFLALLLISNILLVTVAGRRIAKNSNSQEKKEPQWFKSDHGKAYIPGIGRVGFPPRFGLTPHNPFNGGSGGAGIGTGTGTGSGRSYVPGGDDTFVPNPGFEVPIPGSGGRVPPAVKP